MDLLDLLSELCITSCYHLFHNYVPKKQENGNLRVEEDK